MIYLSIFETIPANFFSLLASPNREIYADAVILLGKMFKYDVNILLDDYIVSLISVLEDRELTPEEDDDETEGSLTINQKARLIINKLVKTGWIEKEYQDGTFTESIILHDYSIKTINLLGQLANTQRKEYNSLVFSTYSSLKQAKTEEPERMYEALISATENTRRLVDELKSLYHNIREYHRAVSRYTDVNEILRGHFDGYKHLIDKIYHPIKTMDSVHRYSTPIRDLLIELLSSDALLDLMCKRAMSIRQYTDLQIAENEIRKNIDYVLETYASIGGLIDEIDRKHTAYTKNSIEKMQYLLTADRSIKGKLIVVLQECAKDLETHTHNLVLSKMHKYINIGRQEFVDSKSLYHKNTRSRRIVTVPLKLISDVQNNDMMRKIFVQFKDIYSISKAKAYISALLANKNELEISEISIRNDEDFILLMMSIVRGDESEMPFKVQIKQKQINLDGYIVPEVTFINKEI